MKVLLIANGFLPAKRYGGPPVSMNNFCSLMDGYDCYIVTTDRDIGDSEPYSGIHEGWNDRGNCKVRYVEYKHHNAKTFGAAMDEIQPDWIFVQSLFQSCTLPSLWEAKKRNIKVLLAPRGELCKGAFRKKYKKLPYIAAIRALNLLKHARFLSTSDEETEGILSYLCNEPSRVKQVANVPSIPAVPCRAHRSGGEETKFVFLSRIHPKKNLLYAIRCLQKVKGRITFDIYGPKEDPAYWSQCEKEIGRLPETVRVNYCGEVDHENVHKIYSQYDGLLFPTLSENYGHAIVEALIAGCPVVLSDQTPWVDVAEYQAGWAIPLDDEEGFVSAMQTLADEKTDVYSAGAICYAAEKLNLQELREKYRQIFEEE